MEEEKKILAENGQPTFEGLSQYCPPRNFELVGRELTVCMDSGYDYELRFARDTVTWGRKGEEARTDAFVFTQKLRAQGVRAESDLCGRSLKAQFKYANKIDAEYTAVIGDDELAAGSAKVKCMADGQEEIVPFDKLKEYFA